MSDNKEEQIEEVIDVGTKLAQTLREVIEDAEEAGCTNPFPDFELLLEEWELAYAKYRDDWRHQLTIKDKEDGLPDLALSL